MSQALYRKWRPHLWNEVVGQEHVIHTLQNAVRSERVGHAYLFAGPRGTGKTTTARLLAKAVNCEDPDPNNRPCNQCAHCVAVNEGRFLDLIEIDAASNTSVDDIRELRDKINFAPSEGKFKVYIIDEVHMLSTAAFNALLKTLEEPPSHAIFVLATTEVHKIPPTVLSRCQRHEFRRIPVKDIVDLLQEMADNEKISIDEDALILIARQATGSLRDAISLLDQLASTGEKITLETAQTVLGTATNQLVLELVEAIQAGDAASGLNCIHSALDSGSDARQFARQMVEYLRSLLLIQLGNSKQVDATSETKAQMEKHAHGFSLPHLIKITRLFNSAASDIRSAWQPSLPLELAFAEAVEAPVPESVPASRSKEILADFQRTAPSKEPTPEPARKKPVQTEQKEKPTKIEKPAKSAAVSDQTGVETKESQEVEPKAPEKVMGKSAEEPAPSQDVTMQDIKKHWRDIRSLVRDNSKPTAALLNSCRLLGVKNGTLILGFASDVLRSKMNSKENLSLASRAISHILNANVAVKCIVISQKASETPEDPDIDEDGMVKAALNLGGQIVDKG